MRVTRVRKASKPERISQRRVRPPENEELECNFKRRDADVAISKDIRKYKIYIIYTYIYIIIIIIISILIIYFI